SAGGRSRAARRARGGSSAPPDLRAAAHDPAGIRREAPGMSRAATVRRQAADRAACGDPSGYSVTMRTLLVASVLALAVTACSSKSHDDRLSASDARDVLINRNWLDRMPETTTDRLHVYRFVPNMGGGVYQDRT